MSEGNQVENRSSILGTETVRAFNQDTEPTFEVVASTKEERKRKRTTRRLRRDMREEREYRIMVAENGGIDPFEKVKMTPAEKWHMAQLFSIGSTAVTIAVIVSYGPFAFLTLPIIFVGAGLALLNMDRSVKKSVRNS